MQYKFYCEVVGMRRALFVTVLFVLLDQATKAAVQKLMYPGQSIPLIPRVLSLTYAMNTGAAFGILGGKAGMLAAFTVVAIILFLIFFRKRVQWDNIYMSLGISLWVAGALGNLIDRIRVGMVIDFIDLHYWPVFNVADSSIFIGSVLLLWYFFKNSERDVDDETGTL